LELEQHMPDYCVYLVGPQRRILAEPSVEQLQDDSEALMRATRMVSEIAGAEVWLEQRVGFPTAPEGRIFGRANAD
jgi:hypothetical protein